MKKAQSIQFNWIFVVVSGVIILLFFMGFGLRYVDLQKSKENADIARSIDKIINGLKGQEQYKEIDISAEFNYQFNCDSFKINDDYTQNLNGKIVFSDRNIKVKNLYAWAKEFRTVFKIDNLVYLVDPRKNFFLIRDGNENYVDELKQGMPSIFDDVRAINFDDISRLEIKNSNNLFVFFNQPTEDQLSFVKNSGKYMTIDTGKKIAIFDDGKSQKTLNDALVYGAIFSGNYEGYECGFEALSKKFDIIKSIYIKKSENLQKCCSSGFCDYGKINSYLGIFSIENEDYDLLIALNNDLYNNECRVVF